MRLRHGFARWGHAWCSACNRWLPLVDHLASHGHGQDVDARRERRLAQLRALAGDERPVALVLETRAQLARLAPRPS
jgi:hypothetical protein